MKISKKRDFTLPLEYLIKSYWNTSMLMNPIKTTIIEKKKKGDSYPKTNKAVDGRIVEMRIIRGIKGVDTWLKPLELIIHKKESTAAIKNR